MGDGTTGGGRREEEEELMGATQASFNARIQGDADLYPWLTPGQRYNPAEREGDTPVVCHTDRTPMFKKGAKVCNPAITAHYARNMLFTLAIPFNYVPNLNVNYMRFSIKYEGKTYNAQYIQIILYPNPVVLGIIDESDHVYSQPLHAMPHYDLQRRPKYPQEDLLLFTPDYEERRRINKALKEVGDKSLAAEVH